MYETGKVTPHLRLYATIAAAPRIELKLNGLNLFDPASAC
jgi:hypothetical protein